MIPQSTRTFRYFTYIAPILKIPLIKTYGSIIFTIVTLIIFIIFAIKPTIQTIIVLQKTLENQHEVLSKLTKKGEDLSLARRNYQNISPDVKNKIENAIPASLRVGAVISSLEGTTQGTEASVSALQFQTIATSTTVNNPPTQQEIDFTFNVEGTYETIQLILNRLHTTQRSLIIDKLTITNVEDKATLLMTVSGKAFYLR